MPSKIIIWVSLFVIINRRQFKLKDDSFANIHFADETPQNVVIIL